MKSLNDDERYLKRVTLKTFEDNGVNYYFDVPKYMRILKEKKWSAEKIAKKAGQMQANHKIPADAKIKVGRTYGRVKQYCEGDVDKKGTPPSVDKETIKQLGMVFEEMNMHF